ncbi:hypothetical protein F5887DRAFT_1141051 [Amanita rubescens]|nr:hypothetical protein F5887DRAFT_1141051 [Amanita rubescens]
MPVIAFTGSLQQKKKSELQEIAAALKISDQGTREHIQVRIKEHLDEHHDKLEDNPKFAGLYSRRRKSASRFASVAEEADSKPISAKVKDDRPAAALETINESVSTPEASPHKAALSTPEPTPSKLVKVPAKTPDRPLPSPPKAIATPKPQQPQQRSEPQLQMTQADILRNGSEMLVALRTFLSNSRNIWSSTAVVELLYILSVVIPWKAVHIPLIPKGDLLSLPVFYPPLEIFRTRAFWLVLLHWFIPTLLVPAIVGNLISFTPGANFPETSAVDATPTPQVLPFDPLTASIVRLAAEIAYPYTLVEARSEVLGLDVLGFRWRVLHASIGLAFAFAEAIAGAPQAFARTFMKEQRQTRKSVTDDETQTLSSVARRAIASEETLVQ